MATVHLRVEPTFCGPASIGTVELIELLRKRLDLPLADAKSFVDRCVFDGESVAISVPTNDFAFAFAEEIGALPSPARYHARVEPG